MKKALLACVVTALALAGPATAGLPHAGTLVPGRSLAGVHLGESRRAVRSALGGLYGVCSDCSRPTWYFTYREFDKHGLAVEFTAHRVSAIYTLWEPGGWHTGNGLHLGASTLAVHKHVGFIPTVTCNGYDALVDDSPQARTAYYLFEDSLWGFGLFNPHSSPCR